MVKYSDLVNTGKTVVVSKRQRTVYAGPSGVLYTMHKGYATALSAAQKAQIGMVASRKKRTKSRSRSKGRKRSRSKGRKRSRSRSKPTYVHSKGRIPSKVWLKRNLPTLKKGLIDNKNAYPAQVRKLTYAGMMQDLAKKAPPHRPMSRGRGKGKLPISHGADSYRFLMPAAYPRKYGYL